LERVPTCFRFKPARGIAGFGIGILRLDDTSIQPGLSFESIDIREIGSNPQTGSGTSNSCRTLSQPGFVNALFAGGTGQGRESLAFWRTIE